MRHEKKWIECHNCHKDGSLHVLSKVLSPSAAPPSCRWNTFTTFIVGLSEAAVPTAFSHDVKTAGLWKLLCHIHIQIQKKTEIPGAPNMRLHFHYNDLKHLESGSRIYFFV